MGREYGGKEGKPKLNEIVSRCQTRVLLKKTNEKQKRLTVFGCMNLVLLLASKTSLKTLVDDFSILLRFFRNIAYGGRETATTAVFSIFLSERGNNQFNPQLFKKV